MRLGIDIGASNVDLALAGENGCRTLKFPIGQRPPAKAVFDAIAAGLDMWGCAYGELDEIRFGSTGAVNMLLGRKGPRIGLLATQGFADVLWLARQNRRDLYDPVARSRAPEFLVAREDVREVGGRIGPDGSEIEKLHEADLDAAAEHFRQAGVEAVAVCLLFAHLDPAHEQACAAALRARLSGVEICLSSDVDAHIREYERTVATCLEAWLRPPLLPVLGEIEAGLTGRGFAGRLRFCDGRGWLRRPDDARGLVSRLIMSGPAAAASAAAATARSVGVDEAIAIDCGSVSADISIVGANGPAETGEGEHAGVLLRHPHCDIESVTLSGAARLKADGIDAQELARAMTGSQEDMAAREWADRALAGLARAVLKHCVARNLDPADLPVIVMGGMGGILGCGIAERLGIRTVLIPASHGAAGAWGILDAHETEETVAAIGADLDHLAEDRLSGIVATLIRDAGEGARLFTAEIAANRHMHAFSVELGPDAPTRADIAVALENEYQRRFAISAPGRGHLFSLKLRVAHRQADEREVAPPQARWQIDTMSNGRLETACGDVIIPAGWRIAEAGPALMRLSREHCNG